MKRTAQTILIAAAALSLLLGSAPRHRTNLENDDNQNDDNRDDNRGSSVQGVVSSVTPTSAITILGGTVTINAAGATIVSSQDDAPLTLADVKPGFIIEAEGSLQPGTPFLATRITVEGPKFDGKLSGPIDSVDQVARRLSIVGVTVAITPETIIQTDDNRNATLAAIVAGMPAEVEVAVVGTSLAAVRISLQSKDDKKDEEGDH